MSNNTTTISAILMTRVVHYSQETNGSNITEWMSKADFSENVYIDPKYVGYTEAEAKAIGGTYLSMAISGFILNVLTLCVVGLGENVNKEVKIPILSLGATDVLSTTFGATPIILRYFRISFIFNTSVCRFMTFFEHASHYTSLLSNAAISLERFVIIFFSVESSSI